jgi:hypothetical protein
VAAGEYVGGWHTCNRVLDPSTPGTMMTDGLPPRRIGFAGSSRRLCDAALRSRTGVPPGIAFGNA